MKTYAHRDKESGWLVISVGEPGANPVEVIRLSPSVSIKLRNEISALFKEKPALKEGASLPASLSA